MDGALIATVVSSSVLIGGAIITGFWRLWSKIGDQNGCIGRLEGKMDGFGNRMHNYETQMSGFNQRVNRLDRRLNGFFDSEGKKINKRVSRRKKE